VLHERVRDHDEVAGEPRAEEHHDRDEKMAARPQLSFAEEEQPEERGLGEEREQPFHRERQADDTPGGVRKARPIRPELKLHRDSRNDPDRKVERENASPETREIVPASFARA
jgi:hypothetical protein